MNGNEGNDPGHSPIYNNQGRFYNIRNNANNNNSFSNSNNISNINYNNNNNNYNSLNHNNSSTNVNTINDNYNKQQQHQTNYNINEFLPGPKYVIISRTDEGKDLLKVNPFLIEKTILSRCNGAVDHYKLLKNGTILIKTTNQQQTRNLLSLTQFCDGINVKVELHRSLNIQRGIIRAHNLTEVEEEEIKNGQKNQYVIDVRKFTKKVNDKYIPTGTILLTFGMPNLPEDIYIGFEKVNIIPYIPNPMRCRHCNLLGHTAKHCKNDYTCVNCGQGNYQPSESCKKKCVNCCKEFPHEQDHAANDRDCPSYKKEKEILAIVVKQKVDRRAATRQ